MIMLFYLRRVMLLCSCLCLCLCLMTNVYASRFEGSKFDVECPIDDKSFDDCIEKGQELLSTHSLFEARACFALAYSIAKSPKSQKYALAELQSTQYIILEEEGKPWLSSVVSASNHRSQTFHEVWSELMDLLVVRGIMSITELNMLLNVWDVYVLHGQFACLAEHTSNAIASMRLAVKMHAGAELFRVLARMSMGRGDLWSAYTNLTAAMQHQQLPADHATCILAQLQTAAIAVANSNMNLVSLRWSGAISTSSSSTGFDWFSIPTDEASMQEIWSSVRSLLVNWFQLLSVYLPYEDAVARDDIPQFLLVKSDKATRPDNQLQWNRRIFQPSPASWNVDTEDTENWLRIGSELHISNWAKNGYVVIRSLLPSHWFELLKQRNQVLFFPKDRQTVLVHNGGLRIEPDQAQGRRLLWDEQISLYIGTRLLPAIARITGLPEESVTNTYTCSIAYNRGGDLKPHTDRIQNAISLSLNLGLSPESSNPWPLYVSPRGAGESEGRKLILQPNDALLYGGVDHLHFRYPLKSADYSMQVIFGFREINPKHCNSQ